MAADYAEPAVHARVEQALDELFAQVLAWGGVITGEHGIGLAKKRWWPEATSEVSRALHAPPQAGARSRRHPQPGKISRSGGLIEVVGVVGSASSIYAHFRSAGRILIVRLFPARLLELCFSMKPGKFTHTIAVLLSSVSAFFSPSAPAQTPATKFKVSKKQNRLNDDVLLKDRSARIHPAAFLRPEKRRRALPMEKTNRHDGFLDWRNSERE